MENDARITFSTTLKTNNSLTFDKTIIKLIGFIAKGIHFKKRLSLTDQTKTGKQKEKMALSNISKTNHTRNIKYQ